MSRLAGKVAVVTGSGRNIGRAIAVRYAHEGAKVVVCDIVAENADRVVEEIKAAGGEAVADYTDVSQPEQVDALVAHAVEAFGGLHVMVNNGGAVRDAVKHVFDADIAFFDRVIAANLRGHYLCSVAAARHMAKHGGGVVINTASIAGLLPGYTLMQYRSSKSAVIGFSKAVAIDLAGHNVRVNVLAPGSIKTPMTDFGEPGMTPEDVARIRVETDKVFMSYQPLKRQGRPEDAAQAVLFLASDRAAQVTGIVMPIDGGITAGDPINHAADIMAARTRVIEDIKRGR
jgi:NAD(P)-dependent dehydrogenase (short-subunit alcohol dehydrogenase family)